MEYIKITDCNSWMGSLCFRCRMVRTVEHFIDCIRKK